MTHRSYDADKRRGYGLHRAFYYKRINRYESGKRSKLLSELVDPVPTLELGTFRASDTWSGLKTVHSLPGGAVRAIGYS